MSEALAADDGIDFPDFKSAETFDFPLIVLDLGVTAGFGILGSIGIYLGSPIDV